MKDIKNLADALADALAAMRVARDACDGLDVSFERLRRLSSDKRFANSVGNAPAMLAAMLEIDLSRALHRFRQIEIGDEVAIVRSTGHVSVLNLKSVGPKNMRFVGSPRTYRISDGGADDGYSHVDDDDLFRIQRDFAKKT